MVEPRISPAWKLQQNPAVIARRHEIVTYAETRNLLDEVGSAPDQPGCYPNPNFNRTHDRLTIAPSEEHFVDVEFGFAKPFDELDRNAD